MKKIKVLFGSLIGLVSIIFLSTGCNNNGAGSEKTGDGKVTELPATSKSKEAVASFQEGLAAFDLADNKKAQNAFAKAIELDPKFGIAYLYRANTSQSSKEFADDINMGKSNLDSASDWEKMYGEYQAANLTGDKKKQIETMEKIAATYPQAPRAQTDLSFAYFGNNEFDKAKAALDKALAMNAKWIPALSGLTTWYLFGNNKDPKKAEENALKVVELAPKSAGAQILLGDAYRAGNDFQKAKDAYAKAVSLDPDSPDGYSKEGNANTYLGNYDEARKNFKDGSTHDNNSSFYVAPTAFTYLYANGDYKTAIKALMDGAGTVDSSNKKAPSQKSSLYTSASMIAFHFNDAAMLKQLTATLAPLSEKADNDLGTAEAKAFAKADALNWQAMVAIADGKYDDAKAKAEEMKTALDPIKDDRKLETYHYLMGQISMKQKNYADAVAHFEKADWTNQIYYKYWLAMANEAAGNKDKAMSLYKEIANYNFNDVGNALVRSEVKKKVATP